MLWLLLQSATILWHSHSIPQDYTGSSPSMVTGLSFIALQATSGLGAVEIPLDPETLELKL